MTVIAVVIVVGIVVAVVLLNPFLLFLLVLRGFTGGSVAANAAAVVEESFLQ